MLATAERCEVGVYHKDIGFPAGVVWPQGKFPVRYSAHARQEAGMDRFGNVEHLLPAEVDMSRCQVVEARVEGGRRVQVMVLRTPLDERLDLVMVVTTERTVWFVKTVYLNLRGDHHPTLNRSRYDRPLEDWER